MREQITHIRSQTERPFAVGFITHLIPQVPDNFEVALEERAPVAAFSFSDTRSWIGRAKDVGSVSTQWSRLTEL